MATKIAVDGTETELEDTKLETLQKAVGGWIERVPTVDGRVLYVNEEGLLKGLMLNRTASLIAGRDIVGDVVVLDHAEEE